MSRPCRVSPTREVGIALQVTHASKAGLKASTRFPSADGIRGPEPPMTYNRPDEYATPADARIAGMGVAVVQSMRTHTAEARVPSEQLELP